MPCVFCEIVSDTSKGHIIYENESHIAFLDRYPITEGHSLVIPKRHYALLTDMPKDEIGNLFSLVPGVAKAVLHATGADAFSLGQNNGRAARQIVPHVHVHVIPRYSNRETTWTKRAIPGDEDLQMLASKIRASIGQLGPP